MKFIREIPKSKMTNTEIHDLEQFGFTLVHTEDSIEVWVEEVAA